MPEVLVASSDSEQSQILATILGHCGLMPVLCSSLKEARSLLAHESIRLVFCGDLLTDGSFRDMLQAISNSRSGLPLIVFSSLHDWKLHFEALQLGAFDCVGPTLPEKQIEGIVDNALLSASVKTGTRS